MPAKAALALVGLYLRARDDFTLRRLPGLRETFGRGLFYWVLARELLPNAWRSTSAGAQHKQATGDDRVFQLFSRRSPVLTVLFAHVTGYIIR
jgi:hypothetical protein